MSETAQTNSTPASAADWMGESDIQRAALRELVQLSTDSAAAEAELERVHSVQTYQADRALEKKLDEITQAHDARKVTIDAEYEQRTSAAAAEAAKSMGDIESQSGALREQLEFDSDSVAQDIKSKYQQA